MEVAKERAAGRRDVRRRTAREGWRSDRSGGIVGEVERCLYDTLILKMNGSSSSLCCITAGRCGHVAQFLGTDAKANPMLGVALRHDEDFRFRLTPIAFASVPAGTQEHGAGDLSVH